MSSQNGYKVVRGTVVVKTVDEYTLKSAYHTAKKGCAGHRDVQKRESSQLQIVRRSAGLLLSLLPSAPRSIAFPNNRSPLSSYRLEPPSTTRPPFVPPVALSRSRRHDFFWHDVFKPGLALKSQQNSLKKRRSSSPAAPTRTTSPQSNARHVPKNKRRP